MDAVVGFFSQTECIVCGYFSFCSKDQTWGYRHQIARPTKLLFLGVMTIETIYEVCCCSTFWDELHFNFVHVKNMHNTRYGDGWGKIVFGMLFFPQRIGKYGATLRWKRFWLLVGWQIRGRLHFDIYNVFLPQFSVGCSPYGWLRRPPWGPDTAGPISQAVISRPPSKSWKLNNPPSHNSPLALICTTSIYSTNRFQIHFGQTTYHIVLA